MQVLTPEEKFTKLRQAALEMIDVPSDDVGELVQMLGSLHSIAGDDPDALVSMKLLVALIETHPSKG